MQPAAPAASVQGIPSQLPGSSPIPEQSPGIEIPPSQPQVHPSLDVELLLKNKLASPTSLLKPGESIALLTHCIQLGKQEGLKAKDKDLIVFIGNTGAGKSTFVNYLCGCKMQRVSAESLGLQSVDGKVVTVKSPEKGGTTKEVMKIGHSNTSMTFMPQIESDSTARFYCDCPGFLDNRGVEINIGNAANIKYALGQAQSVRIVVLINYNSLKADRGRGLKDLINICCSLFGSRDNLIEYKDSILLGITQIPLATIEEEDGESAEKLDLEKLKKWFAAEDSINEFDKPALQLLAQQLFIYDPLDNTKLMYQGALKRDQVLQKLGNLKPITTPLDIFKTVLTKVDLQGLGEIANGIKAKVAEILNKSEVGAEDFKQVATYQESLQQLDIIEHPEVVRLTAETRNVIIAYFKKLEHQFDLNCTNVAIDLSAEAGQLLLTIKKSLQFFDPQVRQAIDTQVLEHRYSKLLLTHEAKRQQLALAEAEHQFRTACIALDFVKAQQSLTKLETGSLLFADSYASTGVAIGIDVANLKAFYTKTKQTYDDNIKKQEEDQKKIEEAQKKLEEERQAAIAKQKALDNAREASAVLNRERNTFLEHCTHHRYPQATALLQTIASNLAAYNQNHSSTGISAAIDIPQLTHHLTTAKQNKAAADKAAQDAHSATERAEREAREARERAARAEQQARAESEARAARERAARAEQQARAESEARAARERAEREKIAKAAFIFFGF